MPKPAIPIDRGAASLLGLDAVVIDTETTGLDPRRDRVVEIAAMNLTAGQLDRHSPFRRLVNPGVKIPSDVVRIHGIDDAIVAKASVFGSVWPELSAYIGDKVLIGHSLDFDIEVLRAECRRFGESFKVHHALDVRTLAELVEPNLRDFSLDTLAAVLGVQITGRHSALGDAMAAGEIFVALVPRLRNRGIRTLAEATRASLDRPEPKRLPDLTNSATTTPVEDTRIDVEPYRERSSSIMTAPPHLVGPTVTLSDALEAMSQKHISSVFVSSGDGLARPEDTGIVTERDVLRSLAIHGAPALAMPVSAVMTKPLITVPSDAFAYVAIGRMNRLGIRHLGVTDPAGNITGALSARDLLRLRAESALELGDEIEQAAAVHELARAWSKLPHVVNELLREGLFAREIAAVISQCCRELTGRAAALAEKSLSAEGKGGSPVPYAFLVLGSAGRDESLLAMDQDNALVFADGAPEGSDSWFETLASRTADILHAAGVPYCKGGVMARNSQWRGSETIWRGRVDQWIRRSNPSDLLSVDIFFDLRCVHGAPGLAETLRQYAFEEARGQIAFAKLLVESAGAVEPGLNWYGGFRTIQGRIDLKKTGLFGIVRGVRALAVARHLPMRTTLSRIEGLKALHAGSERDWDALADAQGVFLDLILRQQVHDIPRGLPPGNTIEVKRLSRREREHLRVALKAAEQVDDMIHNLLFST